MRCSILGSLLGLGLALGAAAAVTAQDVGVTPPPTEASSDGSFDKTQYWVVEFDVKHVRMIAPRKGMGAGRVFWYMLYTLENKTDEDLEIFVSVTATSDDKKVYSDLFLPSVEKAIEKKEHEPLWGKTDEMAVLAKRKPEDPKYRYMTLEAKQKRRCVAVFNAIDPNASEITINVAGLSNEIQRVVADDGTQLLAERVRQLRYTRPGDEYGVSVDSFKLVSKEWVKREVPLLVTKESATE